MPATSPAAPHLEGQGQPSKPERGTANHTRCTERLSYRTPSPSQKLPLGRASVGHVFVQTTALFLNKMICRDVLLTVFVYANGHKESPESKGIDQLAPPQSHPTT